MLACRMLAIAEIRARKAMIAMVEIRARKAMIAMAEIRARKAMSAMAEIRAGVAWSLRQRDALVFWVVAILGMRAGM